jgi:hypothetical protein
MTSLLVKSKPEHVALLFTLSKKQKPSALQQMFFRAVLVLVSDVHFQQHECHAFSQGPRKATASHGIRFAAAFGGFNSRNDQMELGDWRFKNEPLIQI